MKYVGIVIMLMWSYNVEVPENSLRNWENIMLEPLHVIIKLIDEWEFHTVNWYRALYFN